MDVQVAYRFHHLRNEKPYLAQGPISNKANDVVFCGRILMFLAHFFPLSERLGVFNTSNETKYEKDPSQGIFVDFNFYKTFWSLQEYFCNPASLTSASTKWQKFSLSLAVCVGCTKHL